MLATAALAAALLTPLNVPSPQHPLGYIGPPGTIVAIPAGLKVRFVPLGPTGALPTAARGRLPPWDIRK